MDSPFVESFRRPEVRNQGTLLWIVQCLSHSRYPKGFFIDTNGALYAHASGRALDTKGGRLVLTSPALDAALPKRVSAPAPLVPFRYDDSNGRIIVEFEHDPAFTGGTVWRTQIFDLTALPRRRPRTLLDGEDGLTSAFRVPLSLLGVPPFLAHGPTAAGTDATFNQRKDEVEERDRSKDAEANDDPARNCAHG